MCIIINRCSDIFVRIERFSFAHSNSGNGFVRRRGLGPMSWPPLRLMYLCWTLLVLRFERRLPAQMASCYMNKTISWIRLARFDDPVAAEARPVLASDTVSSGLPASKAKGGRKRGSVVLRRLQEEALEDLRQSRSRQSRAQICRDVAVAGWQKYKDKFHNGEFMDWSAAAKSYNAEKAKEESQILKDLEDEARQATQFCREQFFQAWSCRAGSTYQPR